MNEKLLADVTHPACITLELRHDPDGRYRWYEMATDADTEVSAATPEAAWNDAAHVWGSPVWDFRRVAPTVATILADVIQGGYDHA